MTIEAKLGSMVAYQGDVSFEHAGSGGMGRMLKKAVTGEGQSLMKMSGTGEVFFADTAQEIHLLKLENDAITVNGANLLAFDSGINWDIQRVQGVSGMMGGGLFNTSLMGNGLGRDPVRRAAGAAQHGRGAHIRRSPGRDHLGEQRPDQRQDRRQAEELRRPRLRRVGADGVRRGGWVLVQPSEGRVVPTAQGSSSGGGGLLGQLGG